MQKIKSWRLPPHSLGRMPLGYCLWDEIATRVLKKWAGENESMASYKKRFNLTTKRLPRALIMNCIGKAKGNLTATVSSEGNHIELDST